MSHRDSKSDQGDPSGVAAAEQHTAGQGPDVVAGEHAFALDLEAGPILAEFLSQGSVSDTLGDELHAAVSALGEDMIDHLDPAAQHLINSVDLFGMPTDGTDDAA